PDQPAHLESPKLRDLGFTGINPWDRTKAAKLADGTWRYQYEDVTTATGISAADLKGVRSWIDAPYHRLPLPDANTRPVGAPSPGGPPPPATSAAPPASRAATPPRSWRWPPPGRTPPSGSPSTR